MKQIFLDHNSTAIRKRGVSPLLSYFGNPSSIHWAGREAKFAVEKSREKIAGLLSLSDPDEILFTGSATESINTALKGFFFHHHPKVVTFITCAVEHEATLSSVHFLQRLGAQVKILPVNSSGQLDLADLEQCVKNTAGPFLVSLMAANNETGIVLPWQKAAAITAENGGIFHLDAVQAPGKLEDFSLSAADIALASLSAHKVGGATGVGLLKVKKGLGLESLLHGGAQERKRRAGTVNVSGIVSFADALGSLAEQPISGVQELRNFLEQQVLARISGVSIQGMGERRLANTSNFLFEGVRGEGLLMGLDLEGFAVSSGSACNSGSILPSHVLLAMGMDKLAAASALRISLGYENTLEEVELFLDALERVVARIRKRKIGHEHKFRSP